MLITLFFVLSNIFLFASYLYLDATAPVFIIQKDWVSPSPELLSHNAHKYVKSFKIKTEYHFECTKLYDELYETSVEYEKADIHYSNIGLSDSLGIHLRYFFAYAVIVAAWISCRALHLLWWEIALIVLFNLILKVVTFFLFNHFDESIALQNKNYRKCSYIEYEFLPDELRPFNTESFSDFKSYLEAEYERSFHVMKSRLDASEDYKNYFSLSINVSQANFFCVSSICIFLAGFLFTIIK